jgi:hypothetical protein
MQARVVERCRPRASPRRAPSRLSACPLTPLRVPPHASPLTRSVPGIAGAGGVGANRSSAVVAARGHHRWGSPRSRPIRDGGSDSGGKGGGPAGRWEGRRTGRPVGREADRPAEAWSASCGIALSSSAAAQQRSSSAALQHPLRRTLRAESRRFRVLHEVGCIRVFEWGLEWGGGYGKRAQGAGVVDFVLAVFGIRRNTRVRGRRGTDTVRRMLEEPLTCAALNLTEDGPIVPNRSASMIGELFSTVLEHAHVSTSHARHMLSCIITNHSIKLQKRSCPKLRLALFLHKRIFTR